MLADIYPQLLAFHGLLRWFALGAALAAILVGLAGWNANRPDAKLRVFTVLFVIAMDIEFLIGLVLFFWLSPVTQAAFANFGDAMKNKEPRFFTVEHTTTMVLAVICAHIGAALSRKGRTEQSKHRGAAIACTVSLLLILAGIPWWRPLLRY